MDEMSQDPPEITCSGEITIHLLAAQPERRHPGEDPDELVQRHGELYQKLKGDF